MKKTINFILILAIFAFTVFCGTHSDVEHDKETTKEHATHEHDSENVKDVETEKHNVEGKLVLDNGKAWLANMETTVGINNMIKLMNAFTEKESVEAYAELKSGLKGEFNMIIKECSMTGEPHNQLHNYLMPMTKMFEEVGSSDLSVCKANFEKLNKHLGEYPTYFK